MIHLGHDLIKSASPLIISFLYHTLNDLIFYDCIKCNYLFGWDSGDFYYWNDTWVYTELSCEELIIKMIIE
jgi:hypothetical protein